MDKAKLKIQEQAKNLVSRSDNDQSKRILIRTTKSEVTQSLNVVRRVKVLTNQNTFTVSDEKIIKQNPKYRVYHTTEAVSVKTNSTTTTDVKRVATMQSLSLKRGKTNYTVKYTNLLKDLSIFLPFVPNKNPIILLNMASASDPDDWKINNTQIQKTNPNALSNTEDGIRYIINVLFEPEYQRGFRRFGLRTVMGSRTGTNTRGYGVPSASWSAADPDLVTYNDKSNIATVYGDEGVTFEYPFTDLGVRVSENPSARIANRQQSAINFIKSWIDEKAAAGDPVEFYIYDGYQLAFHDTEQTIPARGNLAMELFSDDDWINNVNNAQLHFPIPDFRIPSHVEYREGEVIPYRNLVGVYGFIVDASGKAGDTAGGRPPGYFDFYRNRGLNIIGEATPMVNNGGVYSFDEDLYKLTAYMGYYQGEGSGGDFWGNRNVETLSPDEDSEIHVILTWGFQGAVSGWNSRYWDGVSYDWYGMTSEIKQLRDAGFIVGAGFNAYQGSSPQSEVDRTIILDYIANS